jgi:hypothetical protein
MVMSDLDDGYKMVRTAGSGDIKPDRADYKMLMVLRDLDIRIKDVEDFMVGLADAALKRT